MSAMRAMWMGLVVATAAACGPTTIPSDAGSDVAPDQAIDVAPDTTADVALDMAVEVSCGITCPAPPPGCRYAGRPTCSPPSCGTLVCEDASVDATADVAQDTVIDVAPDVSADVAPDTSGDAAVACGASFPTFDSTCAAASDCVVVIHQTDCCGNLRGLGLRGNQRAAFDAAEAVCRPLFPRCGCPTRGILADDMMWTFAAESVGVACTAGRCTTFVRPSM